MNGGQTDRRGRESTEKKNLVSETLACGLETHGDAAAWLMEGSRGIWMVGEMDGWEDGPGSGQERANHGATSDAVCVRRRTKLASLQAGLGRIGGGGRSGAGPSCQALRPA